MSKNYLANTDEKLAVQLLNFSSKVGTYQTEFNLLPAEITSIKNDAAFLDWTVNNHKKIDTYKKNWTAFKNILKKGESNVTGNSIPAVPVLDAAPVVVPPGVISRFSTIVAKIKAHEKYTSAIGENLGIELTASEKIDLTNSQPTLKVVLRGGNVNLLWRKGKFGGVLIEKDSGQGFITLDKDFHPDFIDNSPLPAPNQTALWKYRAIYLLNDEKVGKWSDVVSISVNG